MKESLLMNSFTQFKFAISFCAEKRKRHFCRNMACNSRLTRNQKAVETPFIGGIIPALFIYLFYYKDCTQGTHIIHTRTHTHTHQAC